MAAALRAFRHDGGRTGTLHHACQANTGHHGNNFHISLFPRCHVFSRVARAGCHNLDAFFDNHLCHVVRKRAHEHDVHAKRAVRQFLGMANLTAQPFCICIHGRNDAEAAAVAHSRRQVGIGNPRHAALKHGIRDAEFFTDRRLQHVNFPPLHL